MMKRKRSTPSSESRGDEGEHFYDLDNFGWRSQPIAKETNDCRERSRRVDIEQRSCDIGSSETSSRVRTSRSASVLDERTYRPDFRHAQSPLRPRCTGTTPNIFSRPDSRSGCRSAFSTTTAEPLVVVSLFESRSREVGLAAMDLRCPALLIMQISDSPSFSAVCSQLEILCPIEIIMPQRAVEESGLRKVISETFSGPNFVGVQRKHFNPVEGLRIVQKQVMADAALADSLTKHLALSAACALLRYIEFVQGVTFTHLKCTYKDIDHHLVCDLCTHRSLNLTAKSDSLFSLMNHTLTPMGARLLRLMILQPFNEISVISARLDAVDDLIRNSATRKELGEVLKRFVNLDQLLGSLTQIPKKQTAQTAATSVTSMLLVKQTLDLVPCVMTALESTKCTLLLELHQKISEADLPDLRKSISDVIHEDAFSAKAVLQLRTQRVFAVKAGVSGLLDVARKTYSQTIEEMYDCVTKLRDDYNVPSLRLQHFVKRGYCFVVDENPSGISPAFVQVTRHGKRFVCMTEELLSLNDRNREILEEIYLLTNRIIDDLMATARSRIASLFSLSEAIANLDLLCSLGEFSSAHENLVRPSISESGPIIIRSGRYPLLPLPRPNSVSLGGSSRLGIVIGPNLAGKSIFLRQIALFTIMAYTGCFVPADHASFPAGIDRLFWHAGASHMDPFHPLSSFQVEMRHVASMTQLASRRSLVLVDEMAQGSTSTEDGIAICWALCEYLVHVGCLGMFVTHFRELVNLGEDHHIRAWIARSHYDITPLSEAVEQENDLPCVVSAAHAARLGGWSEQACQRIDRIRTLLENEREP